MEPTPNTPRIPITAPAGGIPAPAGGVSAPTDDLDSWRPLAWLRRAIAAYLRLWRSPRREDQRYAGGLAVWSFVSLVVLIPEGWAAIHNNNPKYWGTISNTVGYLQDQYAVLALIPVALIAITALHAVINPVAVPDEDEPQEQAGADAVPLLLVQVLIAGEMARLEAARAARSRRWKRPRTPGGRVTLKPHDHPEPHMPGWLATIAYLSGSVLAVVAASVLLKLRSGDPGHSMEITMYLLIAALFIVVPSIGAWRRRWETPFASFFATIRRVQHRRPLLGCAIIAGLAILLVHLAMYPWPTRCHLDKYDPATKTPSACFTTP
jgi:hypothetical protein